MSSQLHSLAPLPPVKERPVHMDSRLDELNCRINLKYGIISQRLYMKESMYVSHNVSKDEG
jgi:hypothetical protein